MKKRKSGGGRGWRYSTRPIHHHRERFWHCPLDGLFAIRPVGRKRNADEGHRYGVGSCVSLCRWHANSYPWTRSHGTRAKNVQPEFCVLCCYPTRERP